MIIVGMVDTKAEAVELTRISKIVQVGMRFGSLPKEM